ncbi:hypothetical protein ACFZA2_10320 [Microbacterium sp. NPDC007973]|uniref:hypothetical protein n=1 Tax=Microbacterium sp. NPDC007973 TaxID=3364182 RepID=UPI0036E0E0EC
MDDLDIPLWPWEKIDGPPPSILAVSSIGTQIIGGNIGSVAVYGGSATITNNRFRDPTALHLGWGVNVNASSNDHTPPRPQQDEPPPERNRAQRRAAEKKARRKRDD